ncbi:MAG: C69 family dipeptidase [Atribacterota bacterium]|nr:C69 family dipeptidase [Atribacterota bacterium]
MCDTIIALGSSTAHGITLFGKNSDREPDEAQNINIIPAKKHQPGKMVECTYLKIPQATETYRTILCQPFWMFGAEMGANEYGVAIGNEAIFTRENTIANGLTGMDLVRLALERSKTARQALHTIIKLLEEYGQGGNCGYRFKLSYMNSFIIADRREAFVLETVKRWWAWKKIKQFWSISNVISLEKDLDDCSEGLISNAVKKGYCKSEQDFNFRKCYSGKLMTWAAKGIKREQRSRELLNQRKNAFTVKDFLKILRDHGEKKNDQQWNPIQNSPTICMHAADQLFRRTQTVCSFIAQLGPDKEIFYTTGASNPCISPYFPVFLNKTFLPAKYIKGNQYYNNDSFWWQSELFHRNSLKNFPAVAESIQQVISDYEEKMISHIESNYADIGQGAIDKFFLQVKEIIKYGNDQLKNIGNSPSGLLYRRYWHKYNNINKINN